MKLLRKFLGIKYLEKALTIRYISLIDTCIEVLVSVLRSVGVLDAESVRAVVEQLDSRGRLLLGQRIVVRAWTEPQFRARLLEDADTAAREMGIEASNANAATKVVVKSILFQIQSRTVFQTEMHLSEMHLLL